MALIVLGLSVGAVAVRTRDAIWGLLCFVLLAVAGYRLVAVGLDTTRFVASADGFLVVLGTLLAAMVMLTMSLPKSIEARLVYGPAFTERAFDRELTGARQPFVDAALDLDDSLDEKARWRTKVMRAPPTREWALLADRLAEGDEEWVAHVRAHANRDDWLPWEARTDQTMAEWDALRNRIRRLGLERTRLASRLVMIGFLASGGLVIAGVLNLTNGLFSGPPSDRATFVPERPLARTVHLAPLGAFPSADLEELARFYLTRYDLAVEVLAPGAIPDASPRH